MESAYGLAFVREALGLSPAEETRDVWVETLADIVVLRESLRVALAKLARVQEIVDSMLEKEPHVPA